MQWNFPGCTVVIPFSKFTDAAFQESLVAFLEQASTELVKRFAARTNKAGSSTFESRDTVDPSLITQMLMTLLEANGHRIYPLLLRKRVRDDVCWTDGAQKPWRRCAFWLVLRVAFQRHLCTLCGNEEGRVHYKFLMCLFLARLLDESIDLLSPESLVVLKAKLCRRLFKLEVDKDKAVSALHATYEYMFTALGPIFHKVLKSAAERIAVAWTTFKNTIRKPIRPLPRYAEQRDLYLTLPNSELYLQQVLTEPLYRLTQPGALISYQLPVDYDVSIASANRQRAFFARYFTLAGIETEIENLHDTAPASEISRERKCIELERRIDTYLITVSNAYDLNAEQKSIMLLTVMELWTSLDECATELVGLLRDYNPGFPPEILDVLQLPRFQDMCRLQKIQTYLQGRYKTSHCSRRTIFDDPGKGCFAERYFSESRDSLSLQHLQERIEAEADEARARKEREWRESSAEYEELVRVIASSTCLYTIDELRPQVPVHDDRQCTKCFLQRKAGRMRIQIHEHPLPSNPILSKTVVFELGCPKAIAAYRDVTWKILSTLALPKRLESCGPRLMLCDYSELKPFMDPVPRTISLASTTKSFLNTHYSNTGFPVSLDDVCLPNGLKFGYFDASTKVWPARQVQRPSFAHHCQFIIPANSPFASFQLSPHFAADATGPSSNEVIASQTRCPSELNVHEFMAYQALFSGRTRRWLSVLLELGANNLNFSTEATTLLISQLALQAGPSYKDDPLRATHVVFRDDTFCKRLLEQLAKRLDGIAFNWREINCMEMLITLILRLRTLASRPTIINEAVELLAKARDTTLNWICLLRTEIYKATDASVSRRCSRYSLWAALLCRRTFANYGEEGETLQSVALCTFIECSVSLQDNLIGDPAALPSVLRNALVRDLKMVHRMRLVLRQSLEASPESLTSAITSTWPEPEDTPPRSFSDLKFLLHPNEWWVSSTVNATQRTAQQTIHYHLLEGHLLVDGQPLGQLPAEYRESVILRQLFGNQSLLTYPSGLPGMTYMLAIRMYGHQIHLGFRNRNLIVRAYVRNTVLEFIPLEIFRDTSSFDLPASLIDGCVHWLDLQSGVMEIRQQPNIWMSKPSNWLLDFNTRLAQRRTVTLVNPQSSLFRQVAHIFDRVEYAQQLTVYQPAKRNLSVELRRLELTFSVNSKSFLETSQLRSEVDPNQDAGTWYGLNSKLVLRDAINPRRRSIIVPMGLMTYRRNGIHVAVEVANDGSYGRFAINDVLGRLECPAEPRLLYLKAQFHAYTSFVLPDTLTGRTGTEEAVQCLKSGYCQPWTPLNPGPYEILASIAKLTPIRNYYPKDLRVMQQVSWDAQLTTTIQTDDFRLIVETICKKSEQLSVFTIHQTQLPLLESAGDRHLLRRSYLRSGLYHRPISDSDSQQSAPDIAYDARDRPQASQQQMNVYESVSLICNWPSGMPTTSDLAGILQNWPTIGGYNESFDRILLSDRLAVHFALEWGSLANLCLNSEPKDKYQLMFLFALMSYDDNADMDIIRTLIAFAVLEKLKALDPPKWPSYIHFRQNQVPRTDYLLQLIKPCCIPYPGDERSTFQYSLSSKQRRRLEVAELAYEQETEDQSKTLAQFLLHQWPCMEPTTEGFALPILVDVPKAMEIIRPEWQRLFQNLELSQYTQQVQLVLDRHRTGVEIQRPKARLEVKEDSSTRCRADELPTLSRNLLRKFGFTSSVELLRAAPKEEIMCVKAKLTSSPVSREIQELEGILDGITESQSNVRQQYGRDMMQSLNALKTLQSTPKHNENLVTRSDLSAAILKAEHTVREQFQQLSTAFEGGDRRTQWLREGGLWPCITPVTLLEQLRSVSRFVFGDRMKESIILYALSITTLQRFIRMEHAHQKGNFRGLLEEQENPGHRNWWPIRYPDWLLLEIDANFLIRPDQVDVALATIFPASRSNSVLQMNMGQGKSGVPVYCAEVCFKLSKRTADAGYAGKTSCIMPMVAAVLADTKKLLRVVVPKSLLLQTAQLLHARVGGLLGREVRHVPFSRKTSTTSETIQAYYNIHSEVLKASGVMLALPEHILSFLLSGLQRLSDARISEANLMVKVQAWMKRVCRDVLDECDFTLAVRTQLIFPSGSQNTVDGHPHRWETSETLLQLVDGHLWNLQHDFPRSIEVVRRPGAGFPFVFFLRKDVEDALIVRLVEDICGGWTSIMPIEDYPKSDRLVIKRFISEAKVPLAITERIRQLFPDKPAAKQNMYLLRGLLVHRILLLTLKKRWNVQYGLHPNRDPIAVPFHAKGVPSDQAEWGHPDVALLFSILAFYYAGLTIAQLRQSLEHVLKSDDPWNQYDRWTHVSVGLPDSLRDWNAINVDDETQLMELWQYVRYNTTVIEYFLNNFVFPKHAKQFQTKLQASGWDIPLFSPGDSLSTAQTVGKHCQALTTGFSGTNDSRRMLPLTIKQADLPGLSHTNAEVLTYLLQKRSRQYVLAAGARGGRLSEVDLLRRLSEMDIRILIDAGAQILEMDNLSLAKAWLSVDHVAPAVVYFDTENKPFVRYRHGSSIPLLASPFADDLGDCLVYLDEAHTRGTDLKLPASARGALTLGLGQTKDHTLQGSYQALRHLQCTEANTFIAAMRLRQLATSQSVTFFAPPEVHQSILDLRQKKTGDFIDSSDVICWLLEQTCDGLEQLQPLYFSQGADFCRRTQAASDNPDFLVDATQRDVFLGALRQTERQTLVQLYGPSIQSKPPSTCGSWFPEVAAFMKELNALRKGFQDTGSAVHGSALQEVEQEREIAFEVETVREVQKPTHYAPLPYSGLHRDIINFVKTARVAVDPTGYEQAFVSLRRTALGLKYGISNEATASKLFVSTEFTRTVRLPPGRPNDNFQASQSSIHLPPVTSARCIPELPEANTTATAPSQLASMER